MASKNTKWSPTKNTQTCDRKINAESFARSYAYSIIRFLFPDESFRSQVILLFPPPPPIIFLLLLGFLYNDSVNLCAVDFSMEAAESRNKLHSRLRLWEFPDQYVIEPADGSGAPCLDISRVDASMKLIGSFVRSFVLLLLLFQTFIEINGLLSHPQIKSRNAIRCVSLKSIPYLVWLGC